MTEQTITIETDARGVATLTLTRAEKHNAMSPQLMADLTGAITMLGADDSVRAVIITGEGPSFSAGADLGWMRMQLDGTRDQRMTEARRLADFFKALNELPKPLIGRVQGNAFGGGLGIISVCDIAIGVEGAKFGFTETRLGIIPGTISPYVLARMGEGRARRVFMSARLFDAAEAKDLGLLAKVVSADDLDAAIEREVKPYLSAAPSAVAASKALARSLGPVIDDSVIESTIERLADTWETDAAREGLSAFFDKRKPNWAS